MQIFGIKVYKGLSREALNGRTKYDQQNLKIAMVANNVYINIEFRKHVPATIDRKEDLIIKIFNLNEKITIDKLLLK